MAQKASLKEVIVCAFEEVYNLSDDNDMSRMQLREEGINTELIISFVQRYMDVNTHAVDLGDMCLMFELGWRARRLWDK